jgi:glycosyltransferase involved in cell wall biosynthesis
MPKVSVVVLTYNQKKYIGECIEGAVNQQTNFDYEILVGDDCSTDGTQEIILDYQKRFPDKVKPVLHPKNLGRNGLYNTIETLKQATGYYVAIIDGDDYFLDPLKLQKQADYLDANPTFSGSFHNTFLMYEDAKAVCSGDKKYPVTENVTGLVPHEKDAVYFVLNPPDQKRVNYLSDFMGEEETWFIGTASIMYRREWMTYPEWAMNSISGDIPRYIMLAKRGPIGYMPDIMSVYRKGVGGVSLTDNYRDIGFLGNRIGMYQGINQETGGEFEYTLKKNIARYWKLLIHAKQYENNYPRKIQAFINYVKLGKPSLGQIKQIIQQDLMPKPLMSIYSFFALLPHRLMGRTS